MPGLCPDVQRWRHGGAKCSAYYGLRALVLVPHETLGVVVCRQYTRTVLSMLDLILLEAQVSCEMSG